MAKIVLNDVKKNPEVKIYLAKANEYLGAIGYTEHGERHAAIVAKHASVVLQGLNYTQRQVELAAIAGYLHDIGNVIGRYDHGQVSALVAQGVLKGMGMETLEIAEVIGAIGNHEEEKGDPVSAIAASLILGDKSDVHRSRVRNPNMITFDIHDRVNYAAEKSFIKTDKAKRTITLEVKIDTKISQVMEYFEIFLSRMLMCQKAAKFLKCNFELIINNTRLL